MRLRTRATASASAGIAGRLRSVPLGARARARSNSRFLGRQKEAVRLVPSISSPPSDPFAHAATHDPIEILTFEPRHFLGEHGDALAVSTRQSRPIRSPKCAPWTESIEHPADVRMNRAERIGLVVGA